MVHQYFAVLAEYCKLLTCPSRLGIQHVYIYQIAKRQGLFVSQLGRTFLGIPSEVNSNFLLKIHEPREADMEWIAELTYNRVFVFSWLTVSILILHLAMHFKLPRNERFWKSTDYVWMSLGVIGLLGVTQKVRLEVYGDPEQLYERRLEEQRDVIWSELSDRSYTHSFAEALTQSILGMGPPPEHKNARWYKEILEDMVENGAHNSEDFERIAKDFGIGGEFRDDFLAVEVPKLKKLEESLAEFKSKSKPSTLEQFWLYLSPLIIATGISIRTTKISAEVFGYNKPARNDAAEQCDEPKSQSRATLI